MDTKRIVKTRHSGGRSRSKNLRARGETTIEILHPSVRRDRFWHLPREATFPETGQNRVVTEIIETAVLWALKAV